MSFIQKKKKFKYSYPMNYIRTCLLVPYSGEILLHQYFLKPFEFLVWIEIIGLLIFIIVIQLILVKFLQIMSLYIIELYIDVRSKIIPKFWFNFNIWNFISDTKKFKIKYF